MRPGSSGESSKTRGGSRWPPNGAPALTSEHDAAYSVVERYYADVCCSDDREYYRIVAVDAPGEPALDANCA
jgi:hypothetical protein